MKTSIVTILMFAAFCARPAEANEYGCNTLACAANSASQGVPKGSAECGAAGKPLFDHVTRDRDLPTCDAADDNAVSSIARQTSNYVGTCPPGLIEAPPGTAVALGIQTTILGGRKATTSYRLLGDRGISEASRRGEDRGPKACVGRFIGAFRERDQNGYIDYAVFSDIVWLPPHSRPAKDIYVDGQMPQRIH